MTRKLPRRSAVAAALVGLLVSAAPAGAQPAPREVVATLAPSGALRAAINFGNTVLAQPDPATGAPRGVSAELAAELARRLGVPVTFLTFDSAGKVTDAGKQGAWDVAFLARDPVRAQGILFTAPYVVIEGTYMVRAASPLQSVEEVDRPGTRVAVGRGSAYDLFLTRALRQAELVRAPSSPEAIELFLRDRLEAAAGVTQPLVEYARTHPAVRVIPGRFMVIEQAVGIPAGREAGLPFVHAFVEEMKRSGFVARALAASGQGDAAVAPPAP
ncbi:ABC transporter substrate-binding protein [Roseomonas nepalensis]|uniref:ABC transporter substrate-binding protein n=1 Tax=Muricoccus nepalensis TaxID=1854500 RepID=A0A502FGT6_9PROT|nr:ABC transporter substrate-binding protein [Roseomonas nepalensis]TPG48433.1 ABC transporter substrate-binding protein [Roseomonas nepalensis]